MICFYIYSGHTRKMAIQMVEITEAAAVELKQLLEKENKTDHGLRIFAAGMGCSGIQYGLRLEDTQGSDDKISESNGIKIYFTNEIEDEISELRIDYIDNDYGKGFIIDNPNMQCGSGCSSCG